MTINKRGKYIPIIIGVVACGLITMLAACAAAPVVAGVPPIVYTEVAPRAVNGKGLVEDGADAVTGKDCRVIEGTIRKDRKICETRGSPETKKDFKGFVGAGKDKDEAKPASE